MDKPIQPENRYRLHDFLYDDVGCDRIAIVDFGSQYTRLIARKIRELGVYSEVFPARTTTAKLSDFAPRAIILSGGPESVHSDSAPDVGFDLDALGLPVLGICYGMQWLAVQGNGEIESSDDREFGCAEITIEDSSPLFGGMQSRVNSTCSVWMSHGDRVVGLPDSFAVIASSEHSPIAAMADEARAWYGLQFHPEVTHTTDGKAILENFVYHIAGCKSGWEATDIADKSIVHIRNIVGDEQVLLALSGGVDSSVAALLLQRAIGERLHCIFVDNGLLRQGERGQVVETFEKHFGIDLHVVDAADTFLDALKGITDPEQKRQIIGKLFIETFEHRAQAIGKVDWLAQGTIYPDIIESAGAEGSHLIKSHHNVGGLPERMKLKILEPLAYLFKDEVRALGSVLGLDKTIVRRHPFPGPGLAVRVLGAIDEESLHMLRQADALFVKALWDHDLYAKVAQAFAVILPVKSVGVMGDGRQYGRVIVLRAVGSEDFMTANSACLPASFLSEVASRIVNEVSGITRVCYDLSSKPPATIEWE